jgi:hypothetical protein
VKFVTEGGISEKASPEKYDFIYDSVAVPE